MMDKWRLEPTAMNRKINLEMRKRQSVIKLFEKFIYGKEERDKVVIYFHTIE